MDLYGAITVIATMKGVKRDTKDPFENMPNDVNNIKLKHNGKLVNIPKTVENFFNNPSFICSNVKKFWQGVKKDPKGYIIDVANEFGTEIIYK